MSRAKILSLAKYVLACSASILMLAASGFSQSITVSPASNPPNTTIFVSGSGFSAGADVDIYFDTTDLALAVTDGTGSFSQIALRVPASALPGEHMVSAKERSTGASAQTPFRVDTRWAQFRKRPSHDGHNLGENVLSPATVGGLNLLWKYNTVNAVFSSPAVANGVVYIGSDYPDNSVYALKASTGAKLWKHTTGSYVDSSPAVANGVVYVGSNDNNVYALKASTGALLWKYTTGYWVGSSPAVANGVVYVGSYDGNVYAFGLTSSDAPALPERPDPQTLSPDLSLPVSRPSAILPATDD